MHRTPRQRKLGTEGWNRTNVEGFKDLRPATERPRHETPGWIRTSVYRFRRAMPESTRPQARSHFEIPGTGVEDRTLLHLFVGEGPSTRRRPRHGLAVGAGFEPAHELGNSQLPYRLATPQKLVGDLGFEPRFSWSQAKRVDPFPCPRNLRAGVGGRNRTGISSFGPKRSIR